MYISSIHPQTYINLKTLGSGVKKPDKTRNYCVYNQTRVNTLASGGEKVLPYLAEYLDKPQSEERTLETLLVIDKMADLGVKNLDKMYPYLAKLNDTNSPDIQVMLSGIYRKILVPDAFGPLCRMLHKQINYPVSKYFDPTEETGGAILAYLRAYGAQNIYNQIPVNGQGLY